MQCYSPALAGGLFTTSTTWEAPLQGTAKTISLQHGEMTVVRRQGKKSK